MSLPGCMQRLQVTLHTPLCFVTTKSEVNQQHPAHTLYSLRKREESKLPVSGAQQIIPRLLTLTMSHPSSLLFSRALSRSLFLSSLKELDFLFRLQMKQTLWSLVKWNLFILMLDHNRIGQRIQYSLLLKASIPFLHHMPSVKHLHYDIFDSS